MEETEGIIDNFKAFGCVKIREVILLLQMKNTKDSELENASLIQPLGSKQQAQAGLMD